MQTPPPTRRFRIYKALGLHAAGCFAALAFMAGCGSTTYPSLNGNWSLQAISSLLPSQPPENFNGTLSSSGNSVTGTLYFSNACFGSQALQFSGSIASGNELKITSKAYNNQVIFLTGTVSTDGGLVTGGSYTVTASNSSQPSCDNGDNGNLSGARVTALEGSFTGSLTSALTGTVYPATAQLAQATTASNGVYGVTGSFGLSGLSCFTSGTISAGSLAGNALTLTATSGSATLQVEGTLTATAQNITVTSYTLSGGSCTADSGTGSLTQ